MIAWLKRWIDKVSGPRPQDPMNTDPSESVGLGYSLIEAFNRYTEVQVLRGTRLLLLIGTLLYSMFAPLDYFQVPEGSLEQVLTIRFSAVFIFSLHWFLLARPSALKYAKYICMWLIYLAGAAIILMTLTFDVGPNPYYAGVNLSIIGSAVVPWGAVPTAVVGSALWLTYLLSHLGHIFGGEMPSEDIAVFVGNNFFMASTAVLTTGVNWLAHNLRFEAFRARYHQNRANNELRLANEELHQKNEEVQARTQELADVNGILNERTDDLEAANEQLGEQYRVTRRFLDNMSHELRTPLTCILTPLQSLLAGSVSGSARNMLETMNASADQLQDLINDLLTVRKYESAEVPLHTQKLDGVAVAKKMVSAWSIHADQKNIELTFEAEANLPVLITDKRDLIKVLRNLISNAVKFTEQGGKVTVQLRMVGDLLEFAVTDTGPGIPEDQQSKVWESFFQVDASHTRKHEGTGLGLSLVKSIMERHGGESGLESELGVGTTFFARFPTGAAGDTPDETAEDEPTITPEVSKIGWAQDKDHPSDALSDVQLLALSTMAETLPGYDLKPNILVVEDNENLVGLLSNILSARYNVATARDGQEGLEAIQANKPDLVLSDVMMPRMSGLELLEKVRQDKELERLPFILLTAKAEGPDRVRGLWSGANDYITKPFNPQELMARISNLLRIQQFENYLTDLNEQLEGHSETLEGKLHRLFLNTVKMLVAAIEAKDDYTGGHSERVAHFSLLIAEPFDLPPQEMNTLELGALLHDVGKIGIPDKVLNKPGRLDPMEVAIIQEHPTLGARILDKAPELAELRSMALSHHERWDGKGYPHGLKGADTPLMTRIVSMADCWDAMISDRVYRTGMLPEVALGKIKRMTGTQIDPKVVEALVVQFDKLKTIPEGLRPLKSSRAPTENRAPQVGKVDEPGKNGDKGE